MQYHRRKLLRLEDGSCREHEARGIRDKHKRKEASGMIVNGQLRFLALHYLIMKLMEYITWMEDWHFRLLMVHQEERACLPQADWPSIEFFWFRFGTVWGRAPY